MDEREATKVADAYLREAGYAPLGMRCYGMGCYATPDGRTVTVARVTTPEPDEAGWPTLSLDATSIQRALWAMAMLAEDQDVVDRFDLLRADVVAVCGSVSAPLVKHGVGIASCVTDASSACSSILTPRACGPRHMRVPKV